MTSSGTRQNVLELNTSDLFSAEYAQNETKDDQIVQNDNWHRQQPTVVQRSMSQRAPVTMATVAKQLHVCTSVLVSAERLAISFS